MNSDALRNWTGFILIEIKEHNEEFYQLPGVDTSLKRSGWGKRMSLMPSFENHAGSAGPSLQRHEMLPSPSTEAFLQDIMHFLKHPHHLHLQTAGFFLLKLPSYKSVALWANPGSCSYPLPKCTSSNYSIFFFLNEIYFSDPSFLPLCQKKPCLHRWAVWEQNVSSNVVNCMH